MHSYTNFISKINLNMDVIFWSSKLCFSLQKTSNDCLFQTQGMGTKKEQTVRRLSVKFCRGNLKINHKPVAYLWCDVGLLQQKVKAWPTSEVWQLGAEICSTTENLPTFCSNEWIPHDLTEEQCAPVILCITEKSKKTCQMLKGLIKSFLIQGGQHFNFSKLPDFSPTFPENFLWLWSLRATQI